jgi:hypothetical protein
MKKFAPFAIAAAVMILGASSAEAGWKRNKLVTGPNGGTIATVGTGSCANGSCSSTQSKTGPLGNTAVRSGTTSCDGQGNCTSGATLTGPAGKQIKRKGTLSVQ